MKTYSRKNSSYLKKVFVASNFDETCRLCLSEVDQEMIPIFQNKKILYQEWIDFTVDVLVEEGDGLPPNLCTECLNVLEQSYLFKKKCKASDSKLREHLRLVELSEEYKLSNSFQENDIDSSISQLNLAETPNKHNGELVSAKLCEDEVPHVKGGESGEVEVNCVIANEKPESTKTSNVSFKTEEPRDTNSSDSPSSSGGKTNTELCKVALQAKDSGSDITDSRDDIAINTDNVNREQHSLQDFDFSVQKNSDSANSQNDEDVQYYGNKLQEIRELWNNDEEVIVEIHDENKSEDQNDTQSIVLDVSWEGGIIHEHGVEVVKIKVEESGLVETHRIVTSGRSNVQLAENEREQPLKYVSAGNKAILISSATVSEAGILDEEEGGTTCKVCSKNFSCSKSLKRHMAIHTGIKRYMCNICERRFNQPTILKRHLFTHNTQKPFQCQICKTGYTQKSNLEAHMRKHGYLENKKIHRCKSCSKTFEFASGLSRHLKSHSNVVYTCPYCAKVFCDYSSMLRHKKKPHNNMLSRRGNEQVGTQQ